MKSRGVAHPTSTGEGMLFLRRWLANPLKVGAVLPSSRALARLVARHTRIGPDDVVIELGAGTGAVTKALLAARIPAERLYVIEIDADLCAFLRRELPQVQVIQGDATRLAEMLPSKLHTKVSTVISGIPMVPMPVAWQKRFIASCFEVMAPGGRLLQYTYSLVSPLPESKLALMGKREGMTFLNMPPASVWSYVPARMDPARMNDADGEQSGA